ncbi:MAG: GrpB family protein [Jatrophihabitantaceae bacterium]
MTHPLWRPYEKPSADAITVGRVDASDEARWRRRVVVSPYSPDWPDHYERVAEAVRAALGARVVSIDHVGSTSVPGLAAKPVIDVDLLVVDSAEEDAYVADLERAGFVLVIREPDWEEHRAFSFDDPRANLHVFSSGSVEARRHLALREWLRTHEADRHAYGALKQDLADEGFTDVMLYNNGKSGFIYDLYERIFAADPEHGHASHPRTA